MKWNELKPDIEPVHLSSVINNWAVIDILKLLERTKNNPIVIFPNNVKKQLTAHLNSKNTELGGLLIGRVISYIDLDDGIVAVEITDSIASDEYSSTAVSLSMSSNIWNKASLKSNVNTFVIGWYHSHPNLGAFFSGVDKKTQKDFFNSSYHLGLVIDPIRFEEKWFLGENSKELNSCNIWNEDNGLAMV